jgi:hypothetical protein
LRGVAAAGRERNLPVAAGVRNLPLDASRTPGKSPRVDPMTQASPSLMHLFSLRSRQLRCVAGFLASAALLHADPVTDSIEEAKTAYEEKDYAAAVQALETAAQLVRQQRAEGLAQYLPTAPAGWTAEDEDTSSAGGAMMGGMVSAGRDYNKGDSHVKVQFITDSPMMQAMLMMFNMPGMAGSDGGKLERIKKQKAIVKYDKGDKSGSINIVVGGALLLQIEGNDVTDVELRSFAEAIDYDKLAAAL